MLESKEFVEIGRRRELYRNPTGYPGSMLKELSEDGDGRMLGGISLELYTGPQHGDSRNDSTIFVRRYGSQNHIEPQMHALRGEIHARSMVSSKSQASDVAHKSVRNRQIATKSHGVCMNAFKVG